RPPGRDHAGDHGGSRRRRGAEVGSSDGTRTRPDHTSEETRELMDATAATEPGAATAANGSGEQRNVGRIEEIQGVVIEAVFSERLPEINHAITVARPAAAEEEAAGISSGAGGGVLVCEVQQHLGDDRVRAVAMDTTDGHSRGAEV